MSKNSGRVVIASRYWPTALSLIRSLGMAGFTVDLAASVTKKGESKFPASSRYVSRYVETVCKSIKTADDPGLIRALIDLADKDSDDGSAAEKPVLLPADDYTASLIDRNIDLLKTLYITPDAMGGRQGALTELMNKKTQGRIASECGLPCPAEWIVDLRDIKVPNDVIYPCYVKPVVSYIGYKGEMAKCSTPDELRDHLEYLKSRNPDREILIQEFIEIDREMSISGASIRSRDGNSVRVIIPAVISKGRPAKYERGVAITGTLVSTDTLGNLVEGIEKLLNTMDYNGMFDMDFHCSGDRIYFGEVNLRSGGTCYAYTLSGVNLPAITVKGLRYGAEEISEEDTKLREYGKSFVYEKVLWKDHIQGYLTRSEVRGILDRADFRLINDPSDPAPGELYDKYVRESMTNKKKKAVKRLVKKAVLPVAKPAKELLKGYPQYRPGNSRRRSRGPRVMVMGRNFSSNLCMARSMGMAGYDVEIMRVFSRRPKKNDMLATMIPDAYSKYVKAFHTCTLNGKTQNGADALMSVADRDRKMLLIPTDDISVYIMDEFRDRLKEHFIMPGINDKQGEIIRLMSKEAQKELAAKCGLPMLGSCAVSCNGDRYEIPESVSYPCFIKPDVSCRSSKKRMRKCDNAEELREALDEIVLTASPDLLIEDYVPVKRELSILGLCVDGKVLCPGLIEATSGGQGARRGVAATGVSSSVMGSEVISEDLVEKLRAFMKTTGYNGLFDIDLVETEDGSQYFLEVNLRYGASGYVLTCEGVNLPGIYADHMLKGGPVPDEEEITGIFSERKKTSFVSEKVLMENYAEGAVTAEEFEAAIGAAEISFVRDDEDKRPYITYRRAFEKIKRNSKL